MRSLILLPVLTLCASMSEARHVRIINVDQYTEIHTRYLINKPSNCVSEYITLLDEQTRPAKACHVTVPLTRATGFINYVNLNQNPRAVTYWQGAVSKTTVTTRTFLRELVDTCKPRVIEHQNIRQAEENPPITFKIENPNTDPNISESFMLSPMTQEEANQQFAQTLKACQLDR